MAVRLYQDVVGGNDLNLFIDPETFNKTLDTNRLISIAEVQVLSDGLRLEIALCRSFLNLVDFDTQLQDEEWEIRDRLDYYSLYSNRVQNLTVRDGAWFSPVSVESFCAEDVGNEASRSIDGNNATFWRDSTNHQHIIIFELRSYPKKVSKIRFRYGAGESARERLNNMDVHAAKNLSKIDDAENILETGINITWPTGAGEVWVEHTLAQKKNKARYVKLVIDDTDNGNNQIQIREFEVFVETRDP